MRKKQLLDRAQMVGYDPNEKKLVVTMSEKTAQRMRKDGWAIQEAPDIPAFITVELTEAHNRGQ